MRKGFVGILLMVLSFNFLIPLAYFAIFGFVTTIQREPIYDPQSMWIAVSLNVLPLLAVAGLVWKLRLGDEVVPPGKLTLTPYYYGAIAFSIYVTVMSGGTKGVLEGTTLSKFWSYSALFLGIPVALLISMYYQTRYKLWLLILALAIQMLCVGSRNFPIWILYIFFVFMGSANFAKDKKTFLLCIAIASILAVPNFYLASLTRRASFEGNTFFERITHVELQPNFTLSYTENGHKDRGKTGRALDTVIARLSSIEVSMIPVRAKKASSPMLGLFYEKYGLVHQLKLWINNMIPGHLFERDVTPNMYYRAIFLGEPIESAKAKYVSINMTFPVYLYLASGSYWIALFGYAMMLLVYFFGILLGLRYFPLVGICLFISLIDFLAFFDLTDVLSMIFRYGLTAFACWCFGHALSYAMSHLFPSHLCRDMPNTL